MSELYFSLTILEHKTIEDTIIKSQSSKSKTKVKIFEGFSNFCEEVKYMRQSITFSFEGDIFSEKAQRTGMIMREAFFG